MRQLKEGMHVIYKLDVELDDGEYDDDEEDQWVTEPTTQMFRLQGRIIKHLPSTRPAWWDDADSLRFVADSRLPEVLFTLGHTQPTLDNPWYIGEADWEEIRTFRDWAKEHP